MFAQLGSRARLKLRLSLALAFVVIVHNEWLSLIMCRWNWIRLGGDGDDRDSGGVRLLLVADPQIQGYLTEPAGIVGSLTRWDADRFLENSFATASSFVDPHVIVFLGDLTDEGSIATDAHFEEYRDRFYDIFRVPDTVKLMHIPGDNDIGGEGLDMVTDEKSRRFYRFYGRETYVQYGSVELIKINLLTRSEDYKDIPAKAKGKVRVLLSHIPLLPSRDSIVQKVVTRLNPDFVLSAHEHVARLLESGGGGNGETVRLRSIDSMEQKGRVWRIDSRSYEGGGSLYEIQVPTCSYRMGVPKSGYGFAHILDSNGRMEYTVLWLPGRFPQLYLYLGTIVLILMLYLSSLFNQCTLCIQLCSSIVFGGRQRRSRFCEC